nr:hypothetical transcript [Hymenolepis microstoma]
MTKSRCYNYQKLRWVTGGELSDRIVEKGGFTEKDASDPIRHVLLATEYMHSRDVVHRDLKSDSDLNRLLTNAQKRYKHDTTIDFLKWKLYNMNDIREARITKNSVDSFTIRLQREHQFLQCVIDSFIPFELKKNP